MSKKEKLFRDYALHEKLFFIAVATLLAIIGWTVNTYEQVNTFLLGATFVAAALIVAFIIHLYLKLMALLTEIENE